MNKEAARLYYRQKRLDDAARHLEKATQVMEVDFHGLGMLLAYCNAKGDIVAARRTARRIIEQVERLLVQDPDNGAALAFGVIAFATLSDWDRARQWTDRALLVDPDNLMMRYNFAWGFNRIFDDREAALEMLRPVFANAGANVIRLAASDPNLDSLRDDPRFQEMISEAKARIGNAPINATAAPIPLES